MEQKTLVGTWKNDRPFGVHRHSQYLTLKADGTFQYADYYGVTDLLNTDHGRYAFADDMLTLTFSRGEKVQMAVSLLDGQFSFAVQSCSYNAHLVDWSGTFTKVASLPQGKAGLRPKTASALVGHWTFRDSTIDERTVVFRADGTFVQMGNVPGHGVLTITGRYTYAKGMCILTADDGLVEQWRIEWVDGNHFVQNWIGIKTPFRRQIL